MDIKSINDLRCVYDARGDSRFVQKESQVSSNVRHARERESTNPNQWPYMQKTIRLDGVADDNEAAKKDFLKEVKILHHARHHHVVKLIDQFTIETEPEGELLGLAIVMNRAEDGSLENFLAHNFMPKKPQQYCENISQGFSCLASVVEYIHSLGIRHRDIKPANILVHQGRLLLADFGISVAGLGRTLSTTDPEEARARTQFYCAPEVEDGSTRGRSADIFSLGAVFLRMVVRHSYGRTFYQEDYEAFLKALRANNGTQQGSFSENIDNVLKFIKTVEKRYKPHEWQHHVLKICREMLKPEREDRISASRALQQLSTITSLRACTSCTSGSSETPPDAAFTKACGLGAKEEVESQIKSGTKAATVGGLHQAAAAGCDDIVRSLLYDHDVPVDLENHGGETALYCAASYGRFEAVRILLQRGADVMFRNVEWRTALHAAAGGGHEEVVKQLLEKNKDLVGGAGDSYETALDMLLENPKDPVRAKANSGETPLHLAARRGHQKVAERIVKFSDGQGSEYRRWIQEATDARGRTALHLAAGHGSIGMVGLLLDAGADVLTQDRDKSTVLHYAAKGKRQGADYKKVMTVLIEKSGKSQEFLRKLDNQGNTAYFYADSNSVASDRTGPLIEALQGF